MNGYINGTILGRMYSFSFAFSHFALILLFQLLPRLLSFMMSNSLTRKLGGFSVWIVFMIMAFPAYYGVKLSQRTKKLVNEKNGVFEDVPSQSSKSETDLDNGNDIETELQE